MKKLLLGVSTFALFAAFSAAASATDLHLEIGVADSATSADMLANGSYVYGTVADKNTMDGGAFEGGAGVANVSQNAGANAIVQQTSTVGAVLGGKKTAKYDDEIAAAAAISTTTASSTMNTADVGKTGSINEMSNSFADFAGIANVSQNTGANSIVQNASTVGVIKY